MRVTHRLVCDAAVDTAEGWLTKPSSHGPDPTGTPEPCPVLALTTSSRMYKQADWVDSHPHVWIAKSHCRSKLTVHPLESSSEKPHFSQSLSWRKLPTPPNTHFSLASRSVCVCGGRGGNVCVRHHPCTLADLRRCWAVTSLFPNNHRELYPLVYGGQPECSSGKTRDLFAQGHWASK